MTALAICSLEDGFHIVSDGACYDDANRLVTIGCKVSLLPEFSGFVAARGYGLTTEMFLAGVAASYSRTFDDVLERTPVIARGVQAGASQVRGEWASFSLYVGGWSESREQFESYVISTEERDAAGESGAVSRGAWELKPLSPTVLAPLPAADALESLGLIDNAGLPDITLDNLAFWIHAARISPGGRSLGPHAAIEAENYCGAGVFIQETQIARNSARTRILFRYDDPFDEPIVPKPGEAEALRAALFGAPDQR